MSWEKLFNSKKNKRIFYVLACIVVFVTTYMLVLPALTIDEETAIDDPAISNETFTQEEVNELETVANPFDIEQERETALSETNTEQTETITNEDSETEVLENAVSNSESKETEPAENTAHVSVAEVTSDGYSFKYESDSVCVYVTAPLEAFPQGTTMEVTPIDSDDKLINSVNEALDSNKKVKRAVAVDIKFFDEDGNEIQPACDIKVSLVSDMIKTSENTEVIHIDDKGEGTVVEQSQEHSKDDEIIIETKDFSPYVIAETEEITVEYLTADGETYEITVKFSENAGIPEGSVLVVEELSPTTKEFDSYVSKAAQALENDTKISSAKVFDISIMNGEEEIEPNGLVTVTINYKESVKVGDMNDVTAVHFGENKTEVLDVEVENSNKELESVSFSTDSFSIYAVVIIDKEEGSFVIEDTKYKVTIAYTKEANIPIGTEMTVRQIEYDTDEYKDLFNQTIQKINEGVEFGNELEADPRKGLTDAIFFDISLKYQNEEIEPAVPLKVRIEYKDGAGVLTPKEEENGVVHFGKNGAEIIDDVETEVDEVAISFEYMQDSFSPVGTFSTGKYTDADLPLLSEIGPLSVLKAAGDGEVGAMVASKVLDPNDDGTYTLKLKVTGQAQSGTSSSVTKSNVVIVVDVSGSMGWDAGRYLYTESAQTAYNNTSNRYSRGNRYYKDGTAFYISSDGYNRVYPTYDGSTYRWATQTGYNGWSDYTGPVYKNGTRIEATKSALNSLVDALLANNKNETITDADGKVITLSDTIEITLVKFAGTSQTQTLIRNATTAGSATTTNSLKGQINSLSANGGTNWEKALQLALDEANLYKNANTSSHAGTETDPIQAMANETTSVIFFTDGLPTYYVNNSGGNGGNGSESANNKDNVLTSWNHARDDGRTLITNGFTVYNIFAFGADSTSFTSDYGANGNRLTPSDYLKAMTNFEYGATNNYNADQQYRNNATTTYTSDYFFDASDTTKLQQAFEKIINSINNLVAFGGVDIYDGVSFGATNSTVLLNDGTIDPTSFTYTVSTGTVVDYTVRVNSDGLPVFTFGVGTDAQSYTGTSTTVQVPDPTNPNESTVNRTVYSVTIGEGDDAVTYVMPPAKLYSKTDEDGVTRQGIEWDLTGIGTLNGGQSYELSFIVWPNQDAYDLIAELNNGHITLAEAAAMEEYEDIVPYINGSKETGYSLSTNWEQYVNYYIVEAETDENNNTTYTYTVQDPVKLQPGTASLVSTKLNMVKRWDDSLDSDQLQEILWGENFKTNPVSTEYKVYLRIWKDDTINGLNTKVESNGDNYDQRIVLGWDSTISGSDKYKWATDYTISPGVMVKEGDTAAVDLGLTKDHHPGYLLAKYEIDGATYYYFVLESGHYYTVTEENTERHFELVTKVYHPMVINGVISDVEFGEVDEDDPYKPIIVSNVVSLSEVVATNTLKGGINVLKRAFDSDTEILATDDKFTIEVTLKSPDGQPYKDWDYRIYYGQNNPDGSPQYDGEGNITGYGRSTHYFGTDSAREASATLNDDGTVTYNGVIDPVNGGSNTIILDLYLGDTVRIINVPAGVTYVVDETKVNGVPFSSGSSGSYVFDEIIYQISKGSGDSFVVDTPNEQGTYTVHGNSSSQATVYNKVPSAVVGIRKIGNADVDNLLSGITFKLYKDADLTNQVMKDALGNPIGTNGLLTTDQNGLASIGTLAGGTYYLAEKTTIDGYNLLTNPVVITVSKDADGKPKVSYIQNDYAPSQSDNNHIDGKGLLIEEKTETFVDDDGISHEMTYYYFTLTINNSNGIELPNSGGPGTSRYLILGSMMIAGSMLYEYSLRRNRKRKEVK